MGALAGHKALLPSALGLVVGLACLAHHEARLSMLFGLGLGHHDVGSGLQEAGSAALLWELLLYFDSLPHGEGGCLKEQLQPAIGRGFILHSWGKA